MGAFTGKKGLDHFQEEESWYVCFDEAFSLARLLIIRAFGELG
jgi:hypothetical protein